MEDLREQHAVGEEIAEALTQGAGTTGVDEDELDEELAELQQEQLDERMLKTGSVPVSDQIQRMPSAPSKFLEIDVWKVSGRVANNYSQRRTRYRQRRKTRRRSCGNCRPRWPCKQRHWLDRSDGVTFVWVRGFYILSHYGGAALPQSLRGELLSHLLHIHEYISFHTVQVLTQVLL